MSSSLEICYLAVGESIVWPVMTARLRLANGWLTVRQKIDRAQWEGRVC